MRFLPVLAVLLFVSESYAQGPVLAMPAAENKLSPTAQIWLNTGNDDHLFFPDANGRVDALIQVKDPKSDLPCGIVSGKFGNIFSLRCTQAELQLLSVSANVEYIDIFGRLNRSHALNDTTRILSAVDKVYDGLSNGLPANYRGQGVITGIVDIGFQPDNPTFFNSLGNQYRVRRWWHQSETAGSKPAGYSYGSEFTNTATILAARNDDGTHGTHVGGIAAGSGYTTPKNRYMGMAPESDLVFVTIKYANDTLGGSARGDYVVANPTILDGFKYIFDYAQSQGKPAVINLSWGMHTGPHDGNSLFDRAVETLTGPGKILVGACGNEAGNNIHIETRLNADTQYTFAVDRSRNDYLHESIYCDFWGDSLKSFGLNISVFDTLGNLKLQTPFYYSTLNSAVRQTIGNGTDTLWFTLAANKKFINNGKPEILLMAETNYAKNQRIRIGLTGNGRVDGWNSGQVYRWTSGTFTDVVKGNNKAGKYLNGKAEGSAGENGGTGKSTITAGAYVARNRWTDTTGKLHEQNWLTVGSIAGFSSRGPTTDGRIKPDVAAPGQNVASAVNYRTFSPWMMDNTPYSSMFYGNRQYWTLLSGTSMAAPHVTGIVALMLQVNPNLSPAQIRSILQKTAIRDAFTGTDSNNTYGYGKINAFDAVKMLVNLHVKDPVKRVLRCEVYPNPADAAAIVNSGLFAGRTGVFSLLDITGKEVLNQEIRFNSSGLAEIQTQNLPDGMYEWIVNCNNNRSAGRLLIRH